MAGSMPDARVGRVAAVKEGSRVTTPEPSVPAAPDAAPPRRVVDENPPTDPIPVVTEDVMGHVEPASPALSPPPPQHEVPEVPAPRREPIDPPVDVPPPASESWSDSINASLVVASPRRRPRAPVAAIAAGAAALLVVVAAVAWWMLTPGDTETSTTHEPAPPSANPGPDEQLLKRLNAIFPTGSCRSTPSADTVAATATCTTADPNWPPSATYTLAPDRAVMTREFDAITRSLDVQICPGRIQSPGPWRRLATPDRVAGTVVCGMQAGVPTVAWTTDSDLLISTIHGGNPVPTLDQLYDWWTRHS